MFFQNISQLLLLAFLVTIPFTCAQNHGDHHDDHHETCQEDKDCGERATCVPSTHQCQCRGQERKDYIIIEEAKPNVCQKPAEIEEPCKYDEQCTTTAGNLARCNKESKKCQCYGPKNNGGEAMRLYRGICYYATTVNHTCINDNQCQASIKPEDHIRCHQDSNRGKGVCRCDEGEKCEEKAHNGAGGVEVASIVRFALVGIMATKVFL